MGDHGLAIMATRNELALETTLRSDVAPIHTLVRRAFDVGGDGVVALKDPTRGGLSSALHEMAEKSDVGIIIDETVVPLRDEVRAVGELLGIDPLVSANEGKAVFGLRPECAARGARRDPLAPARTKRRNCRRMCGGSTWVRRSRHGFRKPFAGGSGGRAPSEDLLSDGRYEAYPSREEGRSWHPHDRAARTSQLARRGDRSRLS